MRNAKKLRSRFSRLLIYVIDTTIQAYGRLNVLVNNHGVQVHQPSILEITREQLMNTFQTNIISFFDLAKAALPHLRAGSFIINTTSDTAYAWKPAL
ncbi:SDR family oxidoreductase [Paenibacillus filicis]|uniref:SDR family oxidoreductase n=1 Tax=Paenibacillus filicis TaxID=669464 RepID=A0ABU9DCM1_9BACL